MLAIFTSTGRASGGETYLLKIYGFWQPQYRGSPFGPFVNRNHFAGWMLMVLPLAAAAAYGAAVSEQHDGLHQVVSWLSRSPVAARMQLMTLAATVMGLSVLLSSRDRGCSPSPRKRPPRPGSLSGARPAGGRASSR
jgi:hypothetical protein